MSFAIMFVKTELQKRIKASLSLGVNFYTNIGHDKFLEPFGGDLSLSIFTTIDFRNSRD